MVAGSCHQMHMLNFQQHTLDCICYAMCVVRSVAFVAAGPFGVVSVSTRVPPKDCRPAFRRMFGLFICDLSSVSPRSQPHRAQCSALDSEAALSFVVYYYRPVRAPLRGPGRRRAGRAVAGSRRPP